MPHCVFYYITHGFTVQDIIHVCHMACFITLRIILLYNILHATWFVLLHITWYYTPHGLLYYITHGFIVQLLYATWFDHWQRWQPLDNWCRTSSGNFSCIKFILILMLIVNIILNFTFSVFFVLFNPLPAEFLNFQFRNLRCPAKNIEPGQVAWLCKQLRFKQSKS